MKCPDCESWGRCEYEKPVVDYVNGGFLDTVWDTCENCDGSGEIEEEDEE